MELYSAPHTCTIRIQILLQEIGDPCVTERIDVAGSAAREPAFLAANPKGKVPTLVRDDGRVLTAFTAITTWLARTHPDKALFPDDPEHRDRHVFGEDAGAADGHPDRMFARPAVHNVRQLWGEA